MGRSCSVQILERSLLIVRSGIPRCFLVVYIRPHEHLPTLAASLGYSGWIAEPSLAGRDRLHSGRDKSSFLKPRMLISVAPGTASSSTTQLKGLLQELYPRSWGLSSPRVIRRTIVTTSRCSFTDASNSRIAVVRYPFCRFVALNGHFHHFMALIPCSGSGFAFRMPTG